MKWIFIIGTFLIIYSFAMTKFFLAERSDKIEAQNTVNELKSEFQRWRENDLQNQKNAQKIAQAAKEDKSNFDWHYDISNSPVIEQLRSTCKSCSTSTD